MGRPGLWASVVATVLALFAAAGAGQEGGAGAAGQSILDTGTFWRCHCTWRTVVYTPAGQGEEPPKTEPSVATSPPPAEWIQPDFRDRCWLRTPGPVYGEYGFQQPEVLAMLCLRGKFRVSDPAKAGGLKLSCAFRGGAVVYLNGTEVARSHVGPGKLTAESLAEPYPPETYATPEGLAIRWGWHDPENNKDRCELRIRKLTDVALPERLLRKGVNVLAIEIHRAATRADSLTLERAKDGHWSTAGLVSVRLSGAGAEGVEPNLAAPPGLQVETLNPLEAVFDGAGYTAPAEPLEPLRIVGARSGTFSGQVVLRSDNLIAGPRVMMGDLTAVEGGGRLPASAVSIRHALPTGSERSAARRLGGGKGLRRFDALADQPQQEARTHVVWVSMAVPADAAAGAYQGRLTIHAGGKTIEVPVRLEVSAYVLPAPKDLSTHLGLIESPESVALQYKVPLWSEEHFKLVARSLELLGQLGNDMLYLPLVCRTHFGNEQSLVRWVRRADGSFGHDYGVFDRYVDLAIAKCGRPEVVCLYVWDYALGGGYFGKKGKEHRGPTVSVVDPASGKVEPMVGPVYGTPEGAAFMKPVMEAIRTRLNRRGIDDGRIMVGIAGDTRPYPEVTAMFASIAPCARWVLHSHAAAEKINDAPVGIYAHVWGTRETPDPADRRLYGWRSADPMVTVFPRFGAHTIGPMWTDSPLAVYWKMSEAVSTAGCRGFGRVGADFWPVLEGVGGRRSSILGRYPEANWHQLGVGNSTLYILEPGPAGALATVRFEAIRQGVQECEARIRIEKALTDEALRRKLGDELAGRCQRLLDDRTQRTRAVAAADKNHNHVGWQWYAATDWQGRAVELFDAAAAVARALAK